ERDDGASDEEGRLGFEEVRVLFADVAPVRFGDAKVLQHAFRAEEARSDGDGGDTMLAELGGPDGGKSFVRELRNLTEDVAAGEEQIVLSHLDDEAAAFANHQGRGVFGGDDVG